MTEEPKLTKGEEELALHIAETTDVSVNRAKELMRKHGADLEKIQKEAKLYKAES